MLWYPRIKLRKLAEKESQCCSIISGSTVSQLEIFSKTSMALSPLKQKISGVWAAPLKGEVYLKGGYPTIMSKKTQPIDHQSTSWPYPAGDLWRTSGAM